MRNKAIFTLASLSFLALAACAKGNDPTPATSTATTPTVSSAATPATTISAPTTTTNAEIGKPAPDFTLKDLDGKDVHLADYKGKVVVLEWFNPKCPFVNMSHTKGSLKGLAQKHAAEGVVWLAVNSGAQGKQGASADDSRDGAKRFDMTYPVLLDPNGTVGHEYGATNTPNMFVIDKTGTLVYSGAIDNSPDGEGESPTDGHLVNYVDAALSAISTGKAVAVPKTKAYGCGVKYGS